MHDFCYVSKREAAPIKAELIDLIHRVQDYVTKGRRRKYSEMRITNESLIDGPYKSLQKIRLTH